MLSRRSIRIKVMQQLYALNRNGNQSKKEAIAAFDQSIDKSYELCAFTLYALQKIAQFAAPDAERRAKKHIKTELDKNFTAKLAENEAIDVLTRDEDFQITIKRAQLDNKLDSDLLKKIYKAFIETDEFKKYQFHDSDLQDHRKVLLDLFRCSRNHELFKDMAAAHYSNWSTDKSLAIGLVKKIIKAMPYESSYMHFIKPVDTEVEDFGRELLILAIDKDDEFSELIKPKLDNWDPERLAIMDTIILKMALVEFLYFSTIPVKVTLNEYLDLSKNYSTARSKDFVNGVLDRLMFDLKEKGMIVKEGRGLVD